MQRPRRSIIKQEFYPVGLLVGLTPTPLNQSFQQSSIQAMFDAFIISVPRASANAVILGDSSVSPALHNGLEIIPGQPVQLSIDNERQLYEVQAPLVDEACATPEAIPFVAWDLANIYLASFVAPQTIGLIFFKNAFL